MIAEVEKLLYVRKKGCYAGEPEAVRPEPAKGVRRRRV